MLTNANAKKASGGRDFRKALSVLLFVLPVYYFLLYLLPVYAAKASGGRDVRKACVPPMRRAVQAVEAGTHTSAYVSIRMLKACVPSIRRAVQVSWRYADGC